MNYASLPAPHPAPTCHAPHPILPIATIICIAAVAIDPHHHTRHRTHHRAHHRPSGRPIAPCSPWPLLCRGRGERPLVRGVPPNHTLHRPLPPPNHYCTFHRHKTSSSLFPSTSSPSPSSTQLPSPSGTAWAVWTARTTAIPRPSRTSQMSKFTTWLQTLGRRCPP